MLRRLVGVWRFVHFSSMIAAVKEDRRSPQGRNLLAATAEACSSDFAQ
jgi:hypothetical protein